MNLYKDGDICNFGDIFHDCDQIDWCSYNDYILGIVRERDGKREKLGKKSIYGELQEIDPINSPIQFIPEGLRNPCQRPTTIN